MIIDYAPDFASPLVIGAIGMDELRQNIRIILQTLQYSIPLVRSFAHKGKFIDAPNPLAAARLAGELSDAIEKLEPRVKVQSIEWKPTATAEGLKNGTLQPVVRFSLKKGVEL